MADPHDPNSIPMLTDVIVPGRPPLVRPGATHPEAAGQAQSDAGQSAAPASVPASASEASSGLLAGAVPRAPSAAVPTSTAPDQGAGSPAAAFDARDVEFIAERLRSRFSTYMRQDARGMIEARCREAVEEHTNWLVRQVTREVVSALEQEVAGWVRDAVTEELARHTSRR